jgi:Leu/Phe-tRNA-protein transferase
MQWEVVMDNQFSYVIQKLAEHKRQARAWERAKIAMIKASAALAKAHEIEADNQNKMMLKKASNW